MRLGPAMRQFLKEPLLHFVLLGAALFAAHGLVAGGGSRARAEIVVTPGRIEHLATTVRRTWQRPPTPAELKGLIDDHVTEEILYREALALGLDENDTVIRRRLRQKMEFVAEDFATSAAPTDQELRDFLRDNAERFAADPRYTFRHAFLSADRADALESDAEALLAELRADGHDADIASKGDRLLLAAAFRDELARAIDAQLGRGFAEKLDDAPIDAWSGPFRSSYGLHLVHLTDRTPARTPELDEVRAAVERELLAERREDANRAFLDALLAKYDVTIQWPDDARAAGAEPDDGAPRANASTGPKSAPDSR